MEESLYVIVENRSPRRSGLMLHLGSMTESLRVGVVEITVQLLEGECAEAWLFRCTGGDEPVCVYHAQCSAIDRHPRIHAKAAADVVKSRVHSNL